MAGGGLDVGANSFEFYEGIRILVPGGFVVALLEAVNQTLFDEAADRLFKGAFSAAIAAVGFGLFLYFFDVPRQSAQYNTDLPSAAFIKRYRGRVDNPLNAYFVVSDDLMPSAIRARALYMGSMFRIALETTLLLGLTQIGMFAWAARRASSTGPQLDGADYTAAALAVLLVVTFVGLWTRAVRLEASQKLITRLQTLAKVIVRDVGGPPGGMIVLVAVTVVAVVYRMRLDRWVGVVICSGLAAYWSMRMVYGVAPQKEATKERALLTHPWVVEWRIRGCTPPRSYVSELSEGFETGGRERGAGRQGMASAARRR